MLVSSVYPYFMYFVIGCLTMSLVIFFKFNINLFLIFICVLLLLTLIWMGDINMESGSGLHNFFVYDGFKLGFMLFIFSEFMFFFGIFWFFFDGVLVPMMDLGFFWPPFGIFVINPFGVPFLNSFILLSSGMSVTWCHFNLLKNNSCLFSLFFTLFLAFFFLFVQFSEYLFSSFSIGDSVYGTIFFFSTGFHGLHVFLGGFFLLYCLLRFFMLHFNIMSHNGFEFSIMYWHFVDVVWLFLFIFIYWWSL